MCSFKLQCFQFPCSWQIRRAGISWLYGINSKHFSSLGCYLGLIYFHRTLTLMVLCCGRSILCNMLWRKEMFHNKRSFWLFLCLCYHLERRKGGVNEWWSRWTAWTVTSLVMTCYTLCKLLLWSGMVERSCVLTSGSTTKDHRKIYAGINTVWHP